MSLALYRKYRPAVFSEVVGQEHVTEPLMQALRNGRVHHAYLFSGPRGCGKTSSARILARSLNCAEGPTPTPCGRCDSCVALEPNGAGSLDVIEIDAASHGGVDDARDLRERAFFAPVSSRYKVYIIDEAHMVTSAGFNALLKLVEEPPEFLKFVFATTDPQAVIGTIKSRTHHYPFRLVPPGVLRSHLAGICAREGIEVEPAVLPLVVRAGAGSVRDAMSVLDQLLAGAGPAGVTYVTAVSLLGFTDVSLLDEVIDAIAAGDGAAVFEAVDRVMEAGHDPRRFAADLLERLRDLVILKAVPDAAGKGLIDQPPDQLERMSAQAAHLGAAQLSRAADLLHAGLTEMRGTTSPRLLLELVCARVLLPTADHDAVLARLERLERRLEISAPEAPAAPPRPAAVAPPAPVPAVPPPAAAGPVPATAPAAPAEHPAAHPPAAAPLAPLPAAASSVPPAPSAGESAVEVAAGGGLDAAALRRVWPDVLEAVKARKRTTHALLSHAQVQQVTGRSVTLSFQAKPIGRQFTTGVNVDVTADALREVLGVDWQVQAVLADATGGGAPDGAAAAVNGGPAQVRPSASRGEPAVDGFAPGDAAAEDDDTDAQNPQSVRRTPEEAAVALLQDGLGAKVIGRLEAG